MTSKELLYVEDALGHETFFQQKCSEAVQTLQDPKLRSCVQQMADRHSQIFRSLYGLL
ncbi:MAG: hypothetical protein IJ825_02485 [Oscillospiraceae bacterium]|nr:hypothetical protein [Oscillospiraceae bacterium]MBR1897727.1 hypothetical protein [Oscillospiraceae bacterium]